MADDSALKQRLRTDLTTAIKSRDKLRSGTLRMVLTAITEAEVAGSASVDLTDAQVLDVVIRRPRSGGRPRRRTSTRAATSWRTRSAPRAKCWPTTCRSR